MELLTEDDFVELPVAPAHKWILLERIAKSRLDVALETADDGDAEQLMLHYMGIMTNLGRLYSVGDLSPSSEATVRRSLNKFLLAVATIRTSVWAEAPASFGVGRVTLKGSVKVAILDLAGQIEIQIGNLNLPTHREAALHKCLEDFRREINQPRTRVGAALASLSQVAAVVALGVATIADGPDAYSAIMQILGSEQAAQSHPNILLLEEEKLRLLPAPKKQIEDHSNKGEP